MEHTERGDFGERLVSELASETYLKYWCYPNPKDENGNKKEICDLLILFRDTAIICSVKNYSFNGNYERYFRRTLQKALDQIKGAEKRLFGGRTEISVRHIDRGLIQVKTKEVAHIHRVIINHNIEPLFYLGGKLTEGNTFAHIFNWEAFLGVVKELNTIKDFIDYLKEREIVFRDKIMVMMGGTEEQWDDATRKSFWSLMRVKIS